MKLIALIDTKRNIYHFSNKYKLNWTSTNIVEISKQKNIPNFSYGENIEGLTCIVGPNGAGKTRFMNKIFNNLITGKSKNEFVCQVYEESEKLLYLSNSNKKVKYERKEVSKYEDNDECVFIKYSAAIDTNIETSKIENEKYFDISNTAKYFSDFLSKVCMDDMFAQVKFVNNTYDELVKETDFIKLSNKKVIITTSQQGQAIFSNKTNILSNFKIKGIVINSLTKFINEAKNDITKALKLKLISIIMSISEDSNNWELYIKGLNVSEEIPLENILSGYLSYLEIKHEEHIFKNGNFDKVLEFINKFEKNEYEFSDEQDRLELGELLRTIEDKKINDIDDLVITINGNNILEELSSVIMFNWDSISSGEYSILNLFGRIDKLNIPKKIKTVFLLIDEVDIGLHPEWQRKWASIVPKYLNSVLSEKKINLILSTHSPIILSDIPKNNLILKEREDVYENMKETFGQNIHNLLTDSFFLDNTIGEFSKKHIEELLIILTPIHEQLYADVIKQQEEEVSFKDIKENINKYSEKNKKTSSRFLKSKFDEMLKAYKFQIEEIEKINSSITLKRNKHFKKMKEKLEQESKQKIEEIEYIKEKIYAEELNNLIVEENKQIIHDKSRIEHKIRNKSDEFIKKLKSEKIVTKVFNMRARAYLSENKIIIPLVNNDTDSKKGLVDKLLLDSIENQIMSVGEEFYRGVLIRKLEALKLLIDSKGTREEELKKIEKVIKHLKLTEDELKYLIDEGATHD